MDIIWSISQLIFLYYHDKNIQYLNQKHTQQRLPLFLYETQPPIEKQNTTTMKKIIIILYYNSFFFIIKAIFVFQLHQ